MIRYLLYARKSTDEEDRQVLSIEAQITELREFARKEGLTITAEFVESRTAKEPELRRDAISRLGNLDSHRTGDALASMYSSESDTGIRKQIVRALFVQGNGHAMVEIARKETDIDLKKEIVRCLSNMQSKEGTEYLLELLNK